MLPLRDAKMLVNFVSLRLWPLLERWWPAAAAHEAAMYSASTLGGSPDCMRSGAWASAR